MAMAMAMAKPQPEARDKPDLIWLLLHGPTADLEIRRSDEPHEIIDLSE